MAQSTIVITQETMSNENSISTKEFLNFEKTCEAYKDSDEEIKMIFNEITKLSSAMNNDNVMDADVDDVELILKRAEDIANETENMLKSSSKTNAPNGIITKGDSSNIPQIKVTKPVDNKDEDQKITGNNKVRLFI